MAAVRLSILCLLVSLLGGCAKERPVERVLPEPSRVDKHFLKGTFLFLKSVVEVKSPGPAYQGYAPGLHLEADRLVQFVMGERQVDVVSIDPLYRHENAAAQTRTLASFPAHHIDVVRKKNADGEPTHEEEESQMRRMWQQRDFVFLETTHDFADPLENEVRTTSIASPVDIDLQREALNFSVDKFLKDGTSLRIHYSFLRYRPSTSYVQRSFPPEQRIRFGLFHTTTYRLDAFDQLVESQRGDFMNRWDTSRTVVFYFAPDFPEYLKHMARRVFRQWGDALKSAVGDSVLELRENTGQRLGDLRYNVIAYDDSEDTSHGVLGYSPSFTNPRTGQILKSDVILYGRVLKRALFQEMFWEKSRKREADTLPPVKDRSGSTLEGPVQELRQHTIQELNARITPLNEDVIKDVMQETQNSSTLKEVEERIFEGIFAHEFGHTLGLRHNFLGSADDSHFGEGLRSSSIMDYSFLQGRSAGIGPYDRAAVLFAYSPNVIVQDTQVAQNFLFCGDDDVYSSKSPLCQLYDSGRNLTELVANLTDRYFSTYEVNNLRLERVGFSEDKASYEKRILATLLPIRLIYDNAQAFLQAYSKKSYADMWELAGQRIEATAATGPADIIEAWVPFGSKLVMEDEGPVAARKMLLRRLDRRKFQDIIEDAGRAKKSAVLALKRIALDSSRPEFDQYDGVERRLQVRGVLPDKMLALTLIAAPTDHPLLASRLVSPYSIAEQVVPDLFAAILSNTSPVEDPEGGSDSYYRIRQYDSNLRSHALRLLADQVAKVSRRPEARQLIQIDPLSIRDRSSPSVRDWEKAKTARTELREFYRTLMLREVGQRKMLKEEISPDFTLTDLSSFERTRNEFDHAYTQRNDDTLWVAPMALDDNGIKTASGLLIRNNLNVAEDYLEALNRTRDQLHDDLWRKANSFNDLISITALDTRREAVRRYVTGEQLFLQEMYLAFTQDD